MTIPPRSTRARRYRTVFVDPDTLGRVALREPTGPGDEPGLRVMAIDPRVAACRANVRDAARAVLTWVARITHDEGTDLHTILADCLRPGPDARRVNYAALAARVNAACGTDLTAKRVRTAIANLRRAAADSPRPLVAPRERIAAGLHDRLSANFAPLTAADSPQRDKIRRVIATEILAAVRSAADGLIVKPYGEGIAPSFDAWTLEGRVLDFVRDRAQPMPHRDLQQLLGVLGRPDDSSEWRMRLVVVGARAVCGLLGRDSLAGLLAQLNVLVAGRELLGTAAYTAQLHHVGEAAAALHHDRDTLRYQNWVRRLDESARVPAAIRVASFARNNLATHLLQRIITGELTDVDEALARARRAIAAMRQTDAGFFLLPLTEAIHLAALAVSGRDTEAVAAHFRAMTLDETIRLLTDLAKYDSSRAVVDAVRRCAVAARPDLRYHLIAV